MKIRVAIRHDEPDAKAAVAVTVVETLGIAGFSGTGRAADVIAPGAEKYFELGDGDYLTLTETDLPEEAGVPEPSAAQPETPGAETADAPKAFFQKVIGV